MSGCPMVSRALDESAFKASAPRESSDASAAAGGFSSAAAASLLLPPMLASEDVAGKRRGGAVEAAEAAAAARDACRWRERCCSWVAVVTTSGPRCCWIAITEAATHLRAVSLNACFATHIHTQCTPSSKQQ